MILTLLMGLAMADVIEMEPWDCPRGAIGQSNHNGPWCETSTCTGDSECGGGMVCSDDSIALCVEASTLTCGGLWGGDDGACTETRSVAVHPCGPAGQCVSGTCSTERRCAFDRRAPPKATSPKKSPRGCGTSALGGLLLALAGLFGRRR